MEEELHTLRELKEQLVLLKDTSLDEKQFSLILLTALPESWDSFIGSIDLTNLKSLEISGKILAEAARRKSRTLGSTALVATSKSSNQSKSRPQSSGSKSSSNNRAKSKFRAGVFCHYCKKEGHIRPECRSLARSQSSTGSQSWSIFWIRFSLGGLDSQYRDGS